MEDLFAAIIFVIFIIITGPFILAIFVFDHLRRQWRANELKRRLKEDRRVARQ